MDTGEAVVLSGPLPWRALEILGSAALFYATQYDNPERPVDQVRQRREWALAVGRQLWDLAEAHVGIQTPDDDGHSKPSEPTAQPAELAARVVRLTSRQAG